MGFNETKKIILALACLAILGFAYMFIAEPLYFKKTEIPKDEALNIPDISVDTKFFDKIESLKDNKVILDINSEVNVNPFLKK